MLPGLGVITPWLGVKGTATPTQREFTPFHRAGVIAYVAVAARCGLWNGVGTVCQTARRTCVIVSGGTLGIAPVSKETHCPAESLVWTVRGPFVASCGGVVTPFKPRERCVRLSRSILICRISNDHSPTGRRTQCLESCAAVRARSDKPLGHR